MSFRFNPSGRPFLPPGDQCQIQGQVYSPFWMMMKAHQVGNVVTCDLVGHTDNIVILQTAEDVLYSYNHDVASIVDAMAGVNGRGTIAGSVLRVPLRDDPQTANLFSLRPFRLGPLDVCEFQ